MSNYPPSYERLYAKLSTSTGMSKQEIDIFILKLIKILTLDLHRSGQTIIPYLGKFHLKRMPPRRRSILDFGTGKRYILDMPAVDKLKFRINKSYSKLFR